MLDVFLRYLSTEALFKYFLTLTHSLIIRTKILTGSIEFDLILFVHYLAHDNFFGSNQRLKNSRSCTLIFVKPPEYWVFPHLSSSGWSGPQELSLLPMGTSAPANSRAPESRDLKCNQIFVRWDLLSSHFPEVLGKETANPSTLQADACCGERILDHAVGFLPVKCWCLSYLLLNKWDPWLRDDFQQCFNQF